LPSVLKRKHLKKKKNQAHKGEKLECKLALKNPFHWEKKKRGGGPTSIPRRGGGLSSRGKRGIGLAAKKLKKEKPLT